MEAGVIKPELSGKIVDESHFKFHVECKGKLINAINGMRSGFDFLKTLSHLKFTTNPDWRKNSCNDPNVKVLNDILEWYKANEHRPTRAAILVPLLEYGISIYASDLFFRERGEGLMYQLIVRSKELRFHECFVKPENWYPLGRESERYYDMENNPDAPTIEQEYLIWYGIDVLSQDLNDIPDELRQKIINENIKWQRDYAAPLKEVGK